MPTARLDLDDVGMCHPAPDDDPDNLAVKAEAMTAAWNVFQRHGARSLVVSGALDTAGAIERVIARIPDARWTIPVGDESTSAVFESATDREIEGAVFVCAHGAGGIIDPIEQHQHLP